jgi:hypothetical protein
MKIKYKYIYLKKAVRSSSGPVVASRQSNMASTVNQENAQEATMESENDWMPPPPPPFQRAAGRNLVE